MAGCGRASSPTRIVQIEMRTSAGTFAQVFWADAPAFTEERSVRLPLKSPGSFQRLNFPVPADGASWLRFDPMDAPGEAVIKEIRLIDSSGRPVASIGYEQLRPAIQIAAITRDGDEVRVQTTPAGADPALYFSIGCIGGGSGWGRLTTVTTAGATLVSLAFVTLLIASAVLIGRAAFQPAPEHQPASKFTSRRGLAALWLAVLFLVVFAAKLHFLHQYPVKVPFWDQWDAEAGVVLIPFNECSLSWRAMFSAHNEHRIFFTRLYALDVVLANGQWDPRVQQLCNAALHSFTAVLMATIFWLASGRRRLDLIAVVCALVFAVPFAWQNIILPFQSPFYFLVLFSILALWLTTSSRPGSVGWFLGWVWAGSALFTAASGVLVPVAILCIAALKLLNEPRGWRESLADVAAATPILALGAATASPPLAAHAPLRAHSSAEFATALARSLAWPWIDRPELLWLLWLPLGIVVLKMVRGRGKTTALERFGVGLGVWVVLHAAALAYGRGNGGASPETRYMDFLSLGVVANAMALVGMLDWGPAGTSGRRLVWVPVVGWLVFAGGGAMRLGARASGDLDGWKPFFSAHVTNVHQFVVSGDLAGFLAKPPLAGLPYPDPHRLAQLLQEPYIRQILPFSVRAPLRIEPRAITGDAFVPEGFYGILPRDPLQRSWGSLSPVGNPAMGRFESQPLACSGGYLKFELAGYVGQSNQRLFLKEPSSADAVPVKAGLIPRERWLEAFVRCPGDRFQIVAADDDPKTWFAFREPLEMAMGSAFVDWLIGSSSVLLFAALLLAFFTARVT
jgi:hypothetical protein